MESFSRKNAALLLAAGAAIAATTEAASAQGQPHMQNALRALNNALAQLNLALADKAGHRVKAIDLVNAAIAQVQAGIAAGA